MMHSPNPGFESWPAGRFALTAFPDGAVLLDLQTGAFYRLNAVAAQIGAALLRGESAQEIAQEIARSFQLPLAIAFRDVQTVLEQLTQTPQVRSVNPLSFEFDAAGYLLCWNGKALLRIDPHGERISPLAGSMAPEQEWAARLLWAAPHLLLLRGQLVLHASAVQHPDGVVAFCGASGFGKTTLAHLFAAQGTQLLSEDLVVVSLQGPVPEVMVDGEALIRRWVAAQAPGLANQRQIDTEELSGVTEGPRSRLREILFLRRTGQAAPTIRRESLPHADALVLMLENSFAELGQPAVWARVLEGSCRLVRETSMGCAHLPEGLELLAEAVAGYNWTVN